MLFLTSIAATVLRSADEFTWPLLLLLAAASVLFVLGSMQLLVSAAGETRIVLYYGVVQAENFQTSLYVTNASSDDVNRILGASLRLGRLRRKTFVGSLSFEPMGYPDNPDRIVYFDYPIEPGGTVEVSAIFKVPKQSGVRLGDGGTVGKVVLVDKHNRRHAIRVRFTPPNTG